MTSLHLTEKSALVKALDYLTEAAFLHHNAFEELVCAAEGVPRDAINILSIAAQLADDAKISVPHVRSAAGRWYRRDKERAVSANPKAQDLLYWLRDEVIGNRRAKAVLLQEKEAENHSLIQALYDARVLHVLRRGVATRDRPGIRFDVYALDYGCYVDLPTSRAPRCLFEDQNEYGNVELVQTLSGADYRSSRRSTLNLRKLERRQAEGVQAR
ncbi:MAG TPA: hypothetical protein VII47_13765 [Actinomycetota bacterium]